MPPFSMAANLSEELLKHGIPQLLLPSQMEQTMASKKINEHQAGLVFYRNDSSEVLKELVEELISSAPLRENAQALSKKLKKLDQQAIVETVVNKMLSLVELQL